MKQVLEQWVVATVPLPDDDKYKDFKALYS